MSDALLFEYTVPPEMGSDTKSFIIRELSIGDERQAAARARNDAMRLMQELVIGSLVAVNGTPVTTADDTAEIAFSDMSPPIRSLVLQAYNDCHNPQQEDVATFRKSRRVVIPGKKLA